MSPIVLARLLFGLIGAIVWWLLWRADERAQAYEAGDIDDAVWAYPPPLRTGPLGGAYHPPAVRDLGLTIITPWPVDPFDDQTRNARMAEQVWADRDREARPGGERS